MAEERIGDYRVHPVASMFPLLEGPEHDEDDFVVNKGIGRITGLMELSQIRCSQEKLMDFNFGLVRCMLGLLRGLLELDRNERERLTKIIREVVPEKDRAALRALKW